jgi:hypothetical protein
MTTNSQEHPDIFPCFLGGSQRFGQFFLQPRQIGMEGGIDLKDIHSLLIF